MENSKDSKTFKYYLYRFLSEKLQHALSRWLLRKQITAVGLHFPITPSEARKICFILPKTPLESLFHLDSVLALLSRFPKVETTLVCEQKVSPFFNKLPGIGTVLEYEENEHYLGSRELDNLSSLLRKEGFTICFLLEKNADLPLLILAGSTGAPLRAGFWSTNAYPFINIRVRPSPNDIYLSEQNMVLASLFGASSTGGNRWVVAKKALEEVNYLFQETGIKFSSRHIGIDAAALFVEFGEKWTESLLDTLVKERHIPCYIYLPNDQNDNNLRSLAQKLGVPVISNLNVPQTAALIQQSKAIISGKSSFFQLAILLRKTAFGIFNENELAQYCKSSSYSKGIAFSRKSEDKALKELLSLLETVC
ncbi:MAG: hypothetical protein GF401_20640 [Chitinivibrionales bacterium]|nr:hypothetical protein [Chitinivibrionales bacterium]